MYTAKQAREAVNKYEEDTKQRTLENLLEKENNSMALQIFEEEIFELASKGCSILNINHLKPELLKLIETTDIKTILKFLGYSIETNYKDYKIKW
jgi:hypothetical protein